HAVAEGERSSRPAVPPRAGGPRAGGRRLFQRDDRLSVAFEREHGQDLCREPAEPPQCAQSGRGGRGRLPAESDLAAFPLPRSPSPDWNRRATIFHYPGGYRSRRTHRRLSPVGVPIDLGGTPMATRMVGGFILVAFI